MADARGRGSGTIHTEIQGGSPAFPSAPAAAWAAGGTGEGGAAGIGGAGPGPGPGREGAAESGYEGCIEVFDPAGGAGREREGEVTAAERGYHVYSKVCDPARRMYDLTESRDGKSSDTGHIPRKSQDEFAVEEEPGAGQPSNEIERKWQGSLSETDFRWSASIFEVLQRRGEGTESLEKLVEIKDEMDEVVRKTSCAIVDENFANWTGIGKRVPLEKRKFKPLKNSGTAGGTKFIHNGLLFKLAVDPKIERTTSHLYGGSEANLELASKAASRELQGANSFFKSFLALGAPVQVPLQTIADYRGFRIVALPIFPVASGSTIIYGSEDGGKTIHNSDVHFDGWMAKVAAQYSLAKHKVYEEELYTGGDVEAHKLVDSNDKPHYYMLDLHRWGPPESAFDTPHLPPQRSSIFYRLLRPEYLLRLSQKGDPCLAPLSADTFAGWGRHQSKELAERLRAATRYLCSDVVENVVQHFIKIGKRVNCRNAVPAALSDAHRLQWPDTVEVTGVMHQFGLSIRHLYLVWQHANFTDIFLRQRILAEMLSRSHKGCLRKILRKTEIENLPRELTCYLNCVCNADEKSERFWTYISRDIYKRFGLPIFFLKDSQWLEIARHSELIETSCADAKCADIPKFENRDLYDTVLQLREREANASGKDMPKEFKNDWLLRVLSTAKRVREEREVAMTFFPNIANSARMHRRTMTKYAKKQGTEESVKEIIETDLSSEMLDRLCGLLGMNPEQSLDRIKSKFWDIQLLRHGYPAVFRWWESKSSPPLRNESNVLEFPGQVETRRHLFFIFSRAFQGSGLSLPKGTWNKLLAWTRSDKTPTFNVVSDRGRLLTPIVRLKHMDVVEWAELKLSMGKVKSILLDEFKTGSWDKAWGRIRKGRHLQNALEKQLRLEASGGAATCSDSDNVSDMLNALKHISIKPLEGINQNESISKWIWRIISLSDSKMLEKKSENSFHPTDHHLAELSMDLLDAVCAYLCPEVTTLNLSKIFDGIMLTSSIRKLKNLVELNVSDTPLEQISHGIQDLKKLKILSLNQCENLRVLPSFIGDLNSLLELHLDDSGLISIPSSLSKIKSLRVLSLANNSLNTIPEEIGNLVNLERLGIQENKIKSVPIQLGKLKNLKFLWASDNDVEVLPKELGGLANAQEIDLEGNMLRSLPEEIKQLSSLEALQISKNKLASLPDTIGSLTALKYLRMNANKIVSIPESIGSLKHLETLWLSSNELKSIPEEMKFLSSLRNLRLGSNPLSTIPESVAHLPALIELTLDSHLHNIFEKSLQNMRPNMRLSKNPSSEEKYFRRNVPAVECVLRIENREETGNL